jgi:hypothetical protein
MNSIFEESVREVCDEMTEEAALQYVLELTEDVLPVEEWMAMYLAKKWPSIVTHLRAEAAKETGQCPRKASREGCDCPEVDSISLTCADGHW